MSTILSAIFVFLLVILLHEAGHLVAAKASGIKVNEFAVGMGPKIFGKQKGETLYSFRALPIGGYCAMEGEGEDSEDPRAFNNVSIGKRMVTILAGAFMNFVLAIVAFSIIAGVNGVATTTIGEIVPGSPAEEMGFVPGDKIVVIDHTEIKEFADIPKTIAASEKDTVRVYAVRNGILYAQNVKVVEKDGQKMIGIKPMLNKGATYSIRYGFKQTGNVIKEVFQVLGMLFTGKLALSKLSGPVGVIKVIGQSAKFGFLNVLAILGLISANLGVVNLLPIPALDGGRFVMLLIEKLRGKPLSEKVEYYINLVGFIFVFSIMIYVTIFGDLRRWSIEEIPGL